MSQNNIGHIFGSLHMYCKIHVIHGQQWK